jgi:hypothetical protein
MTFWVKFALIGLKHLPILYSHHAKRTLGKEKAEHPKVLVRRGNRMLNAMTDDRRSVDMPATFANS